MQKRQIKYWSETTNNDASEGEPCGPCFQQWGASNVPPAHALAAPVAWSLTCPPLTSKVQK
eukprot:5611290-Amphidinium_carterae.1